MDPYEETQQEYAKLRRHRAPQSIYEAWMRLQLTAAEKLPRVARQRADDLVAENPPKSSRIAEFVRKRLRIPRPVKAGIGLVALLAATLGGISWRKRRKRK